MRRELKLEQSEGLKRLAFLTKKLVNSQIVGNYKSVFKGSGLEFADYRHYTPDDDASMIDWKASVKSKELLVREFVEERDINVFFLIDASSSMLYSSIDKLKIEYALELVATLGYAVVQAGDSISFALFNDKVAIHEPPAQGLKQYYKMVNTLIDSSHYGGAYNIEEALKFTTAFLREFSIVIIVSDFIGLKNDWQRYLKIIGKKYDLIGVMVNDPLDMELPEYKGQVMFGDVFSEKQILVSIESVKELYRKQALEKQEEVSQAFTDAKAEFLHLMTNQNFTKPITDLFLRRSKRI